MINSTPYVPVGTPFPPDTVVVLDDMSTAIPA
jgi:hypothetical protein